MGEVTEPLGLRMNASRGAPYTLWTHDTPSLETRSNLYGSHPFYVDLRGGSGAAHGVLLLNSNGMDVTLGERSLTYRVIGGVLEFFVYLGPAPEQVVAQHTAMVGRPMLPPFWTLGLSNCRWGYTSVDELEQVVANYSAAAIPLETAWADIDYMDRYLDFTYDPKNFPEARMRAYVDALHSRGQRAVHIVDPGIANIPDYEPFAEGVRRDIFLRDRSNATFIGRVWPGTTAFPDFLSAEGRRYWRDMLRPFLQAVPLDGLWIDMNEAANFCDGACKDARAQEATHRRPNRGASAYPYYGPSFDPVNPPYQINNHASHAPLNNKAIDTDVMHPSGAMEYDAHNLYGFGEVRRRHGATLPPPRPAPHASARRTPGPPGRGDVRRAGEPDGQAPVRALALDLHRLRPVHRALDRRQRGACRRSLGAVVGGLGVRRCRCRRGGDPSAIAPSRKPRPALQATWNDLYYATLGVMNSNLQGIPMVGSDICGFQQVRARHRPRSPACHRLPAIAPPPRAVPSRPCGLTAPALACVAASRPRRACACTHALTDPRSLRRPPRPGPAGHHS